MNKRFLLLSCRQPYWPQSFIAGHAYADETASPIEGHPL